MQAFAVLFAKVFLFGGFSVLLEFFWAFFGWVSFVSLFLFVFRFWGFLMAPLLLFHVIACITIVFTEFNSLEDNSETQKRTTKVIKKNQQFLPLSIVTNLWKKPVTEGREKRTD